MCVFLGGSIAMHLVGIACASSLDQKEPDNKYKGRDERNST